MNFQFFALLPLKNCPSPVDVQIYCNSITATLISEMNAMVLFQPSQIQKQQLLGSAETLQN